LDSIDGLQLFCDALAKLIEVVGIELNDYVKGASYSIDGSNSSKAGRKVSHCATYCLCSPNLGLDEYVTANAHEGPFL
jgi:hypothetical protein